MRLRVSGEGEGGRGGAPPGDLYVVLHVREHEVFQRQDQEILLEAGVSFSQLALGAEIGVPTLDGEHRLTIPAGTQSGTRFRLRGKGVPALHGRGRGDQHVLVQVRTPRKLNPEQRDLLERLAEFDGDETNDRGLFDRVKDIFS